ncbi:MAG: TIGR02253 family HAD-type hydrolase [Candidatus Micrarchaeota archaeon]
MAVRYVLFDIDDTLFPSTEFAELARKNAIRAMIDMGLKQNPERLYRKLLLIIKRKGSNYESHFDMLCKSLKVPKPARFIAAAIAAYHNTKMSMQPYPGVGSMLIGLKEGGYGLYVATDGTTIKQWDKLIRMRIALYFDDVFVSEEMGAGKENGLFRKVLRTLGAKPEECLMVGDREDADILPAKALGMRTVKVMQGKRARASTAAEFRIRDISQLPSVLKRL